MVIPDSNPSKVLVTGKQVQVCPVGGIALAVVIKGEDCSVWLRNATHAVTPAAIEEQGK